MTIAYTKRPGFAREQVSFNSPTLSYYTSKVDGEAYSCSFSDLTLSSGTNKIAFINNDSTTHLLFVLGVGLQVIDPAGGTGLSSANTYWTLTFDEAYSSGGTAKTPVNMNRTSANTAEVTAYDNNFTTTGTAVEFKRIYPEDASVYSSLSEGGLLLGEDDSLTVNLTTDHTSGRAIVSLSFLMVEI